MKNQLSLFLLLCSLTTVIAQTAYEKGNYIDNTGIQTDGYIKNLDWKDNPVSFEFSKTSDGENSISKTIKQVQSFQITGISLYERHRVNIDRASQEINDLGYNRNPEMKEETLFLRVMLDGRNKLYRYRDSKTLKLYYKKGAGDINALIYKRYLTPDQGLASNNYYQQQLLNEFKCDSGKLPRPSSIQYTTGDLLNFFQKYNQCTGIETKIVDKSEEGTALQITAVAGINSNSYFAMPSGIPNADFGSNITPVFGVEFEYIISSTNNKWSMFLDTRFASFSAEKIVASPTFLGTQPPTQNASIDFSSVDVALGFRHYFFLNDSSKIFVNGSYAIEVSSSTVIDYERSEDVNAEIGLGTYGLGIGYSYKDIRLEARYNGTKNHIGKSFGRGSSEYNSFMLTLGYSFAKF